MAGRRMGLRKRRRGAGAGAARRLVAVHVVLMLFMHATLLGALDSG